MCMKTILVTGGAGYIGAHTVNLLKNKGNNVVVVDSFRESRNNIINSPLVSYYEVDLRNKEVLLDIFVKTKPDIVFHFAALASVPDSMVRPFEYYDTNLVGGLNLLECMRETGVTRIVFSSSASTYGEPQCEVITEDHQQLPTNSYGYTKLVFENILKDYNRAYHFSSVSLRYFCASGCDYDAGIGEYHTPETHVIPCIVETLLGKRKKFFVYGDDFGTEDGTGVRDYIHVNDLANAHVCAMMKLMGGEIICKQYNLGINKGFSVLELIRVAEAITGQKIPYEVKGRRSGDPSRLIADSTKAQKELEWTPKFIDVKDMVESTYLSFKNRPIK